jgi:hypothetical protein
VIKSKRMRRAVISIGELRKVHNISVVKYQEKETALKARCKLNADIKLGAERIFI